MKHKTPARFAAAALSALLLSAISASAAENVMTFRMTTAQKYLTESELAEKDIVLDGAMYIENYSGITDMRLRLMTDDPLIIENGDFTRDPSRKDTDGGAKQCFFVSHGTTIYTGINKQGERKNIALWYGPGDIDTPGTVEDPESSFLSYQVRIPKGTKAGVYRGYISQGTEVNIAGQVVQDFSCNNRGAAADVELVDFQVVVEPQALRGDVNCDGETDVRDAQAIMIYYNYYGILGLDESDALTAEAFGTPYIHTAAEAADINRTGVIDIKDSMMSLIYANRIIIGADADWDHLFD